MDQNSKRLIFLTGAAGFMGRHFIAMCAENRPGWKITALVRTPTRIPGAKTIVGDLTRPDGWKRHLRPGMTVVHLAGLFGSNMGELVKGNTLACATLLESCKETGVRDMVMASSAAVYGGKKNRACRENDPVCPDTAYGWSKRFSENLCEDASLRYGMKIWMLRFSNLYGPGACKGVAYLFLKAGLENRPIQIYGDGRQTRDFLYFQDGIRAIQSAVERPAQRAEAINIGFGETVSLIGLLRQTEKTLKKKLPKKHAAPEAHVVRSLAVSIKKARTRLRWKPNISLNNGLAETTQWLQSKFNRGEKI